MKNIRLDVPNTDSEWYGKVRKLIVKHKNTNFNVGWNIEKNNAYVVGESFLSMYMIFLDLKTELLTESFYERIKETQTGS